MSERYSKANPNFSPTSKPAWHPCEQPHPLAPHQMGYIRVMTLFRVVALAGILTLAVSADAPDLVGGISSTAPVQIDGTSMAPSPSWPVVDKDVIGTTSAPGLILTPDQNAITLMQQTTVRVRTVLPRQTWVFVRQGGLSVTTKNNNVLVCIGKRLFQPSAAASGTLELDKSGTVTRHVTSGVLTELPGSPCGDELAAGLVSSPASGAVAGGTASAAVAGGTVAGGTAAGSATAVATTVTAVAVSAGAAAAGLATTVGAASSSSASSCTSSTGCNFNPTPVTPSSP